VRFGTGAKFVGLPDKFDFRPSNRLPMPSRIYDIPPNPKVLGVDAIRDPNTLKALF
jgi:hypothetical protein